MLKLIPTQDKTDSIILHVQRFYLYRVTKEPIKVNDYFIICHNNKYLPQIAKCFKIENNCLYSDEITCFTNYDVNDDIYFKVIETNNPYLQLPRIKHEYIEKYINEYEYIRMG